MTQIKDRPRAFVRCAFMSTGEVLARSATRALLALPLAAIQPMLSAVASRMARVRPDLFARMGPHAGKRFLIDPCDLPFVFTLVPDTAAPELSVYARGNQPPCAGAISGRFLHLLDLVDASLDGDALFFSRKLSVSGDTEAVVALRNALDDFDGDLVREILASFGPFAGLGRTALDLMRSFAPRHVS